MSEVIMIIIIAACGSGSGSGCGVTVDHLPFENLEACWRAQETLFPPPAPDASYYEREGNWQPRREIKCVETGY